MNKFKAGDIVTNHHYAKTGEYFRYVQELSGSIGRRHEVVDYKGLTDYFSESAGLYLHETVENNAVSSGEVLTTSSTGGQKGVKPESYSLLPVEALAKVARHYNVGAGKYDLHQWRKGYEWSKSYDALQRHANAFWCGEDFDQETTTEHMAAVVFHAMTLLTFMDEQRVHDDRYRSERLQEAK